MLIQALQSAYPSGFIYFNTVHSTINTLANNPWRLSVAPMIDVTDKHCRYFHRLLAPKALLYTEMVSTGAILHGNRSQYLDFNAMEQPLALQLGGSNPNELAQCAKIGESWGYNEINLNCGCPSERVQRGAFGACLMDDPNLVAECCKAMLDSVSIPVTVKHRLGLDYNYSYSFVRDFVAVLYNAGVRVFIVHARNAVLKGLSPKHNREIPPLRYDYAAQLKQDFPDCTIVLNGGVAQVNQATELLQSFDGVMLGRAAWHTPAVLTIIHQKIWPSHVTLNVHQVIDRMVSYAASQVEQGVPLRFITKAMLGLPAGYKGARTWRRTLSDSTLLKNNNPDLIKQAWQSLQEQGHANQAAGDAPSGSLGQSRI